jgi:transcription elongation factor Elf1
MTLPNKDLFMKQIELQEKIQKLANINIVTCGHCGTVLMHEMKTANNENVEEIECYSCEVKMNICDAPDLWYKGCETGITFDK